MNVPPVAAGSVGVPESVACTNTLPSGTELQSWASGTALLPLLKQPLSNAARTNGVSATARLPGSVTIGGLQSGAGRGRVPTLVLYHGGP